MAKLNMSSFEKSLRIRVKIDVGEPVQDCMKLKIGEVRFVIC